jgi:hypothetical protein
MDATEVAVCLLPLWLRDLCPSHGGPDVGKQTQIQKPSSPREPTPIDTRTPSGKPMNR